MIHTTDLPITRANGPNHPRCDDDRLERQGDWTPDTWMHLNPSELHASHPPRLGTWPSPPRLTTGIPHHNKLQTELVTEEPPPNPSNTSHSIYPSESLISPRELLRQSDSLKSSTLKRQPRTSRSQLEPSTKEP